ncbi:MAG: hypothetical protein GF411_00240 [Candidatus Lokiarchaeota archaeon]|nr:hypothetical protein [Candidatus Lokiarchaeota archaeon]
MDSSKEDKLDLKVKELEKISHQMVCLRNISAILSESQKSMHQTLNNIVHLIPEAWQFPSITCVRISTGELQVTSANFQETSWKLESKIRVDEEYIGTIEVYYVEEKSSKDYGPFLDEERMLLETIAIEIGRYIERKRIERIRNNYYRELDLYSSFLRHDLKNDVGVILGNVDLARMILDNPPDTLIETLESTEAVCTRMLNLLAIFGRSSKIASQNIVEILEETTKISLKTHKNMNVILDVAKDVYKLKIIESKLLPLVFDNLLRNAAAYGGDNPTVKIVIKHRNNFLEILFSDDGPGISDDIRGNLFEKGVSTSGGGLGLYLSRQVLKALDGSIELLEPDSDCGATFKILIPVII